MKSWSSQSARPPRKPRPVLNGFNRRACPLQPPGSHALASVALACAALAADPAGAEIFKCVAKSGATLYQNFPCEVDSLGSLPSAPPKGSTQDDRTRTGKADAARPRAGSELHVGMSADEVKAILGEPKETEEDEPRKGRVSIWRYADGRVVTFDVKHRVLEMHR